MQDGQMKTIFVILFLLYGLLLNAKDFTWHTLNDKTIHIQNIEGNLLFKEKPYAQKKVLLFFFGTQCPYCEQEIPQIEKLAREKKIAVIAIQAQVPIDDDRLEEFANEEDMDHIEILRVKDGDSFINYLNKRGLWMGAVPYHILIDKYGNLEVTTLPSVIKTLK